MGDDGGMVTSYYLMDSSIFLLETTGNSTQRNPNGFARDKSQNLIEKWNLPLSNAFEFEKTMELGTIIPKVCSTWAISKFTHSSLGERGIR